MRTKTTNSRRTIPSSPAAANTNIFGNLLKPALTGKPAPNEAVQNPVQMEAPTVMAQDQTMTMRISRMKTSL